MYIIITFVLYLDGVIFHQFDFLNVNDKMEALEFRHSFQPYNRNTILHCVLKLFISKSHELSLVSASTVETIIARK